MLLFGHEEVRETAILEKKKGNKYDTVDTAESVCTLWEKNLLYLSAGNIAVQPSLKKRKRAATFFFKKYLLNKQKRK